MTNGVGRALLQQSKKGKCGNEETFPGSFATKLPPYFAPSNQMHDLMAEATDKQRVSGWTTVQLAAWRPFCRVNYKR